jgi:hypothetical protein
MTIRFIGTERDVCPDAGRTIEGLGVEFPIRLDAWVFHCSIGQSLPDENSVLTPSTVIRTKMNTSFGFDLFLFPKKSRLKFFCI